MPGESARGEDRKAAEILDEFCGVVRDSLGNEATMAAIARDFRTFMKSLEDILLPPDAPRDNEIRKGAQAKQFMMQIAPYIQEYMRRKDKGTVFDILDVGARTGDGSNLLASLYQTVELGYRARVTAMDIDPTYHDYARFFCRHVVHQVTPLEDIGRSYDIVIASHVIEHVDEPFAFVEQLKRVCHGLVVICAPYDERPDSLTEGHLRIIDDEFLRRLGASRIDFMESPAWGQFMEPRYKMFIATFDMPGDTHSLSSKE